MILRDRAEVYTGGGTDRFGAVIPVVSQGTHPCSVHPVRSDEVISHAGTTVSRYYRVIVGRRTPTPTGTGGYVLWRGIKLTVYGDVEQHNLRGRLHHREFTGKAV